MRFYTVLVLVISSIGLFLGLRSPQMVESLVSDAARSVDQLTFQKQLEFGGLERLTEQEITELLPLSNSNLSWLLQQEGVTSKLKNHSLVARATLARCTQTVWYDPRCFRIEIVERKPRFIAVMGGVAWVLGEDGTFMLPIDDNTRNQRTFRKIKGELKKSIQVLGLMDGYSSPDFVRAKVELLVGTVDTLSQHAGRKIERISFESGNELEVLFQGLPIRARFEYSALDPAQLTTQALRLRKVLADMRGNINDVEGIDLAFNNLAVVRKRPLTPN